MNWSNLSEFLNMGGYAVYVWGALAGVLLLFALEVIQLATSHRRAQQDPGEFLD